MLFSVQNNDVQNFRRIKFNRIYNAQIKGIIKIYARIEK